jgi:hypothetical protein
MKIKSALKYRRKFLWVMGEYAGFPGVLFRSIPVFF